MNVAVIGASNKPQRYSFQAVKLLLEHSHQVFPVHRRVKEIDGLSVYADVKDIAQPIDTVTLYVSADISTRLMEDLLALSPRRIIFNPGAENSALKDKADAAGIETVEGCTLVMLRTGQF